MHRQTFSESLLGRVFQYIPLGTHLNNFELQTILFKSSFVITLSLMLQDSKENLKPLRHDRGQELFSSSSMLLLDHKHHFQTISEDRYSTAACAQGVLLDWRREVEEWAVVYVWRPSQCLLNRWSEWQVTEGKEQERSEGIVQR